MEKAWERARTELKHIANTVWVRNRTLPGVDRGKHPVETAGSGIAEPES